MTLLDELSGDVLQCNLIRRRYIVEIGIFDYGIEAIITDRAVCVTGYSFGESAIVERA